MVASERVTVMFEFIEFEPDEVHGFTEPWGAVAYLELPYVSFYEIASRLPKHVITPARFGYPRRVLLGHFRGP